MFRFMIRDVLWLTVVVALAVVWRRDLAALKTERLEWQAEKAALLRQRDADVASERRLATMRALEASGKISSAREPGVRPTFPSGSFVKPQSPFYTPPRPQ